MALSKYLLILLIPLLMGAGLVDRDGYYDYTKDSSTSATWQFNNDLHDTAIDISGGDHGTYKNNTSNISGKIDNAVEFDGTDDYVDVADSTSFNFSSATQKLMILAWIYPTNVTGRFDILSKYQADTNKEFLFYISNGLLVGRAYENLGGADFTQMKHDTDDIVIVINTWTHVAVLIDIENDDIDFYINGEQVADTALAGSANITDITNSTSVLSIGAQFTDLGIVNDFIGKIDEVMIIERTLTPQEIKEIYTYGLK